MTQSYDDFLKTMGDASSKFQAAFPTQGQGKTGFPIIRLFKSDKDKKATEEQITASLEYISTLADQLVAVKFDDENSNERKAIKKIIDDKKPKAAKLLETMDLKELSDYLDEIEKEVGKNITDKDAGYIAVLEKMRELLANMKKDEGFLNGKLYQGLCVIAIVTGVILGATLLKAISNSNDGLRSAVAPVLDGIIDYASDNPKKFAVLTGIAFLAAGACALLHYNAKEEKVTNKIISTADNLKSVVIAPDTPTKGKDGTGVTPS